MLPASRKRAPWLGAFFAAGSAFIAAGSAFAQTQKAPPMVDWVIPALAPNKPQTPEQAEEGRKLGRRLPPPEILQPRLDPALPAYQPRQEELAGTFRGGSSDVMTVLVRKWFEKFKTYHRQVILSVSPPYAGSIGAVELVKENLDFVFVSRELKPDDIKEFKAKFGYAPLSVPVSGGSYRHFGALDAMGFFVHKDNPIEQLTFDQIDAMYSSTRYRGGKPLTKWGDLGLSGEWAEKPIKLYGIKPWNGFEEFVRQRILSKGAMRGEWREDIFFEKVVFPMAKHVAEDRYGIGYSGLAYLDRGVRVLPLVAAAGGEPQAPTYENVALATYPLSRIAFFNVNKAPGKPLPPALDELLRFILSREGQQVVLDHAAYLPLRGNQTESARALLEN
jgi:phosphate transport system substrate-binding protein